MIKKFILRFFYFSLVIFLFVPGFNNASEILIYADDISYDTNENIIARGNAKIISNGQLIVSDLIIYEKVNKKIILPTEFTLRDNNFNFLSADSGFFTQSLNYGEFSDIRIKLNDGSRIVGNKGKRDGHVDIISKGVYTPCKSRIKIANFICPTWQLEGEKILHDNKNLFLYQKHSKMRVINTPVFYIPYIVTPSPLRKTRKSGFLAPSLSLNFFDTKTTQSTSFPYYFNIDVDKELTFTPIINYGGGIDSSQRFNFDYNQLLSGGNLSTNLTFDSNFENQNSNKWLSDASLITNYNQNINDKFRLSLNSALETSQNYIQITQPNSDLSYETSLSTILKLEGFNLNRIDDRFDAKINFYQTNQKNEDNKTIPTVLPHISYNSGIENKNGNNINNTFEFYNIFRDKNTSVHAQNQQKLSHTFDINKEIYKYNSKVSLKAKMYNQFFSTENKLIHSNNFHTGSMYRLFPIISMEIETPFKLKNDKLNFIFKPTTQIVLSPGLSNSNKISNEDSSNNSFTLDNSSSLNRYSGSDKIDNSKRLNYGFTIENDLIKLKLSQLYEFTDNSNFHIEQGNNDNLSDFLGSIEYENINSVSYNFRYDHEDSFIKEQNIYSEFKNYLGEISLSYLDQKSKTDEIITQDTETLNYNFKSKKFLKFSNINLSGLYDLKKEINTEYSLGYTYFDECFGINIDFNRKSYEEENLKPQDVLTLMFSFKNIGSYKSSNLAVSETDKEDIAWEGYNIDNDLFENAK